MALVTAKVAAWVVAASVVTGAGGAGLARGQQQRQQPAGAAAATTANAVAAERTEASAVTPAVKNPERHAEFMYRKQEGPIGLLFIGDSITDFWPKRGEWTWLQWAKYDPADFGISGDRTEHVIWRLTNGELDGISPKAVVIMIGTNNIGQVPTEKPEWAAAGVKRIVDEVTTRLPEAKVLLLGVFPRDGAKSEKRQKVEAINAIISKYEDGKRVRYMDIGKRFLDEKGEIPADVMPDGLHPNAKGYGIWYEAIRPVVEEMMR